VSDLSQHFIDPRLRDFRNFLWLVWQHLGLPEPTPIQYQLAHYLQHGPRRSIIEAFRGVGKSWITVAYVLWRLYLNPEEKILVVSASKNLADNFTTFCFQLINTMPLLAHLKPQPHQRNSKIQFDVGPAKESKDPSVRSVGITGQITGGRADLIIPDDIESANNSLTQLARDRLAEAIKEFDAVLKPNGEIKYLGTPQTEMSIYNLLPSRGYEIRIWPARYPDDRWLSKNGPRLAPELTQALAKDPSMAGQPTDPRRFSDLDLAEREASYGRSGFALQFQLDTTLSDTDRYPLKLSDLVVMDVHTDVAPERIVWASGPQQALGDDIPCVGMAGDRYYRPMQILGDWLPYSGSVLAIDPAGRGQDELGYCVAKMLNGYIYVPAVGGLRGGYSAENLEFLAKLAKQHGVNHVVVEANFGDGMFTELIKPVLARIHPCGVEEVRHSQQKERRIIDTLEPIMNQHRLVVDPKVIRGDYDSVQASDTHDAACYMLFHQLSRITREKGALRHDDRLDALAIAVAYWVEAVAQDAGKKLEERKEEKLQEELDRFMDNALGRKGRQEQTWVSHYR
jgi:hypothetical protein